MCKRSSFLNTAFASLHTASLEKGDSLRGGEMPAGQRGPLSTRGTAVRRWRDSFPATAANRFHKELRFFFSLLKRKKEAKKEKSSRFTCTTRSSITRRLHINKDPPAGQTGGCCRRRNTTLFLGRKVSGDSPLSLLKRKKEAKKEKRKEFALHLYYAAMHHPKITHQQKSPGGANRRLVRRNITLFTLEIGA